MRLYKLISRHGQFKERMYPWFEPPAVGAPMRYAGWRWDPGIGEWVEVPVEPIEVDVVIPRYSKPTEPPMARQPLYVPGWYWNGRAGQWEESPLTPQELSEGMERGSKPKLVPGTRVLVEVEGWSWSEGRLEWDATIVYGERIGFTPPPPLPPDLEDTGEYELKAYMFNPQELLNVLERLGMSRGEAMMYMGKYHRLIAELPYEEGKVVWDHMVRTICRMYRDTHMFSMTESRGKWLAYVQESCSYGVRASSPATGIALLVLVFTLAGIIAGTILERLAFVDEDDYVLVAPPNTYLLGPENWAYSKHIGTSVRGGQYFSSCEDIGTEYVRHKRGRWRIEPDVIDFPGGFVETGFQFPYWVKYRWSYWRLEYVGMLMSRGERFYELKESDYNRYATGRPPWMLKSSDWCADFHYYL